MNLARIGIAANLFALVVTLGACDGTDDGSPSQQGGSELQKGASCIYAGGTFEDGRTFSSPDGCNSCTCSNGRALCTKRACQELPPPPIVDGGPVGTPPADAAIAPDAEPAPDAAAASDASTPPADATAPNGCVYGGVTYSQGDSFPSLDKCNSCFCGSGGRVACTKKLCRDAGNP